MRRVATAEQVLTADPVDPKSIHMPSPSYWPLILGFGIMILSYGMVFRAWPVAIIGALVILGGAFGWGVEPSAAPHEDHDDHDDDDHNGPSAVATAGAY
jgi:cytochrome c oxidase subunit I